MQLVVGGWGGGVLAKPKLVQNARTEIKKKKTQNCWVMTIQQKKGLAYLNILRSKDIKKNIYA